MIRGRSRPLTKNAVNGTYVKYYPSTAFLSSVALDALLTMNQQKKTTIWSSEILLYLRRALDSNQRIPYDIGSLANCWFKPLTQPSLNHLFVKERCKYTTYFGICKILWIFFALTLVTIATVGTSPTLKRPQKPIR